MISSDKLVIPLTGVVAVVVVLGGVFAAYMTQKDTIENSINALDKSFGESVAEISKGMGSLQSEYEVRISNLETAKNTDLENRLARVEELTSTGQITDWNQWRGAITHKIDGLETWRTQTDRLFEVNRDSVQRLWNEFHKHHRVE